MDASASTLDLYVDPACPWAWLTSRWLAEVERVRPVRVRTRLFCLAEINRGAEANDRLHQSHSASERALRVLAQAGLEHGDAATSALYTAIGEAYQERGEPLGDTATLERAAHKTGLDPGMVGGALDDPRTLDELLRSHRQAVELGAFGVPTLVMGSHPVMFGPIVDRRLDPGEAAELWDHTLWLIQNHGFFELKRARQSRAQVGRYALAAGAAQPNGGGVQSGPGASG